MLVPQGERERAATVMWGDVYIPVLGQSKKKKRKRLSNLKCSNMKGSSMCVIIKYFLTVKGIQ